MTALSPMPVQIQFKNLDTSEALETRIRAKAEKLRQFYPGMGSCRVTVERLHRHHHQGNHFHVRIDVKTPGHNLVAGRQPYPNHSYADVYVALRDAFQAMRRQLEDLVRKQQGHVKQHDDRAHGHITEISADRVHGRIESVDGRSLYFHRNSLIGADLDQLQLGTPVYFVEDAGDEGPQASSVHLVGKHHILV